MFDASRRPKRRLSCWGLAVLVATAGLGRAAASPSAPALTTVADTVYMADGTPAVGAVIITWPAFVTGSGSSIAAGTTNVTLGSNGALSVALAPNAGANPAGVYYSVVYQLQPGEVRTEYWMVPTATSPVNLAAVRTTPGSGTAAAPASMQYVNTALAAKANDSSVVHLTGPETINGTKSFATPPNVPAPQNTGDVVNKAYVDTAVAAVGAGNYLATAGGTMTGTLTLSGNPTAAMQAVPKQYVDTGVAAKADLVSGVVPAGELGAGTANSGTCLYGNGTWGPCGSGSGNVSTTPAATQAIAEPAGAVFTANRIGQKRMADQFNWKQNPTSPASLAPGTVTVTLSPCPQGFLGTINGSNLNHWIYVDSAPGDAQQPGEPVLITAESCAAGAASGTISFSAAYAHGAGYALESGTGGIKEAAVDANQVRYDTVRGNNTWIEVTPTATTKIKAPLYWQTTMGRLVGSSLLECSVNMSCLNIGDTNSGGFAKGNANLYTANVVDGLWIRPDQGMAFWDVAPSSPGSITAGSTSATLTIPICPSGFWPLIPNQILWLNGTSGGLVSTAYEAGAPGPGEFVQVTGGTCTPGAANGTIKIVPATPGIASFYAHDAGYTLSNGATALIEDNSQGTILENIQSNGFVGNVGYGFLIQNDNNQAQEVRNINIYGGLRCDVDFCGATLFGPGPSGFNAGITHLYEGSNGTCAEWYNGNDLLIGQTVCQGFSNFAIFMSTKRGGSLQRAAIHTVHRERGGVSNSIGQYLGGADIIVQGYSVAVDGNGDGMNAFPAFPVAGSPGGQLQLYYLSIMDVTDGTKTVPIPLGQANVSNPNTNNVTVKWVAADALAGKTINYELYRLAPAAGSAGQVPYPGVCDGAGGDGTCLVASGINPATVCDIHGACVFTDNVATPTAVTPYNGADGSTTGGYFPVQSFSPGGIVLSGGATYQGDPGCLVVMGGPWLSGFAGVVNNAPAPASCIPSGGSFNTVLSGFMNNMGGYAQFGLLFPDRTAQNDGGHWTGIKGRLNFIGGGTYPRDIATWRDSNPAKTMSSKAEYGSGVAGSSFGTVNRPQWDVSDIATGVENAGTGLYERVPANGVFDWYVGALPNNPGGTGSNWTEELSATGHTFKTPVTINGNLTVTGTCTGCGGGSGSSTWSSLTAPTSNLNVNLGTYLTGLSFGDFGSTPSSGAFSVTDTATSTTDTSTNFLAGTGASSRHNSFTAQLNNINQLQICWQPGPQGETVIGSAVACPAISQSPFAKFVAMSATGAHSVERLYQQSSAATGTMLEMNNATAAGTGFNFWKACAGASATDTSCGTGANVASLRGDGYLMAAGGNFTGALTLPITGSGNQCLHVSSTGVVSGTGSDCGAGSGGSGTVNGGTAWQVAMYSGTGTAVSGDAALTDNGSTLSYSGSVSIGGGLSTSGNASIGGGLSTSGSVSIGGGLSTGALTGTSANFTGNLTVGGQLIATGPWSVTGPSVGVVITPIAGTSQAAFDGSGILSVSENGGSVVQIAKLNSNITGTAANLSGTPTLPNGTTATTQSAGDNSAKLATTAYVAGNVLAAGSPFVLFPGYNSANQSVFPTASNTAAVIGFEIPSPITTSKFFYHVGTTADNTTHTYEVGIFNASGTLVLHYQGAGSVFSPTANATVNQSWVEGSTTLPPGKYYQAITTSCTSACATFTGTAFTTLTFYNNSAFTVSAGGTLPSSITAPGGGYESFAANPLSVMLEP